MLRQKSNLVMKLKCEKLHSNKRLWCQPTNNEDIATDNFNERLKNNPPGAGPNDNSAQFSVNKLLDDLPSGHIAFNTPTNINIDDSSQNQLILSLTDTVKKLKQLLIEEGKK